VDPYYLTSRLNHWVIIADVIHSGRRVNDNMGLYCQQSGKAHDPEKYCRKRSKGLIMGITFKETALISATPK